ncbi:ATP-dependent RNA helicase DHX58-like [Glandiceps talaboti]
MGPLIPNITRVVTSDSVKKHPEKAMDTPEITSHRKSDRISPHRKALRKVAEETEKYELKIMKYVCRDLLPRAKTEKVEATIDFFDLLECSGLLTEKDPDFLFELLAEVERPDLAKLYNKMTGTDKKPVSTDRDAIVHGGQVEHLQMTRAASNPINQMQPPGFHHAPFQQQTQVQHNTRPLVRSRSEGHGTTSSRSLSDTPIKHVGKSNMSLPVGGESTPIKKISDSSSDDDDTPLKQVTRDNSDRKIGSDSMDDLSTDMEDEVDLTRRLAQLDVRDVPNTSNGTNGSPGNDIKVRLFENQHLDKSDLQVDSPEQYSLAVADVRIRERDQVVTHQSINAQLPATRTPASSGSGAVRQKTHSPSPDQKEVLNTLQGKEEPGFQSLFKQNKNGAGDLKLREYQKELAEPGKNGNNYIICAPTGSGKTLTAAAVCKNHHGLARELGETFKVIFIVPTHSLIEQQRDAFRQIFPASTVEGIGETDQLVTVLKNRDVVVLTAQILINALNREEVQLTDVKMLILDECHHTTLNHPYNELMRRYLQIKLDKTRAAEAAMLPLVIGLSASLGVGDDDNPFEHVITLAASMDAALVKEVTAHVEELERHVRPPVENKIIGVPGRAPDDDFIRLMVEIMVKIEAIIFTNESSRHVRGTQQYENWIVLQRMKAEKENLRSRIIGCRYLVEFNAAFIYYDDLRACDAIQYLERKVFDEELPHTATQIEKRCVRFYKEREAQLKDLSEMEQVEKIPKLIALVELLGRCFKKEPNSRGIVLTRTRAATIALLEFIKDEPRLQGIVKVDRLVGKGKDEDGFMTDTEQQRAIRRLKQGLDGKDGCNLLVATDIAQEGLDIPTCNFVIKYNFVSNEIGAVQARGRARAEESVCYLIVQEGSKNEQREIQNQEKEKLMKKALKQVNSIPEDHLRILIQTRQVTLLEEYKSQQMRKEERRNTDAAHDVEVVCKECKRRVCFGTDLLRKGTHIICTDPNFLDRVRQRSMRVQEFRDTDNIGVALCGDPSCPTQFGPIVRFKKDAYFSTCALSCKSMAFKIGNTPGYATFKNWAKCTFPIDTQPY